VDRVFMKLKADVALVSLLADVPAGSSEPIKLNAESPPLCAVAAEAPAESSLMKLNAELASPSDAPGAA